MRTARLPLDPGEGFQAVWTRYPRKQAKADAIKAWWQVGPSEAMVTQMQAALDWQIPMWARDSFKFTPLLASWLRGRRFDDEPVKAAEPTGMSAKTARTVAALNRDVTYDD